MPTSSISPDREAKVPEYRRIADGLRMQILNGKWKTGMQMPATGRLATSWKTSYCTIHTALTSLVKEGWIERVRGAGTYVADPKTRFTCAGIFHSFDLGSHAHSPFARSMQAALQHQLERMHKDVLIFTDPRSYEKQGEVLPALADAILHRRIQCLIAPTVNSMDVGWLAQLRLPTAFISNEYSPHLIGFSEEHLIREGLRRLAAKGCRSVGLISSIPRPEKMNHADDSFHAAFQRALRETGLVTRNEWIRTPSGFTREFLEVGYGGFHAIWCQAEKPDALVVYPDEVVCGVITAILETGLQTVTELMKFVFHRNAHLPLLCPFPVIWAISDEDVLAAGLLDLVEKQFAGEKVAPVVLPYDFKEGTLVPALS